jgi:hypothetical protein
MTRDWTEEQIAAHVDGALDGPEDAAIRRAIETDPEARATADRLRALNRLLAEAFPLPAGEIPNRIAAALAVEPDRVVPLARRRRPVWLPVSAAASVALAAGLGLGVMLAGSDGAGPPESATLADAGPALEEALEKLASGTLSEAGVRPLATFREASGRPCREFETGGDMPATSGIACRVPGGSWEVLAIVSLPGAGPETSDDYLPASGAQDLLLDGTLDSLGAGAPLPPGEEAALIRSGWR